MKLLLLLPILFFTSYSAQANKSVACDNLYSNVTYALSHSNKALNATNFEHQMYYAERALIAMEKAEILRNDCGCIKVEEKNFFIIKNLEKAVEPMDWDAGRFFTKKSKRLINELITTLDECSMTIDSEENNKSIIESTKQNLKTSNQINKTNKIDTETLQLAKYISTLEKRFSAVESEINTLLKVLEPVNQPKNNISSTVSMQQAMYIDRTKKLLQKALSKMNKEN
ncbi:hypothetical protein [uncultured Croceitalea sp.]|uniref:hypothetical protein n=1 Tax=uncultured Croceitalea sp. TaxID=1798908 RepID=UPI00374E8B82